MERQRTVFPMKSLRVADYSSSANYTSFEPSSNPEGQSDTRSVSYNNSKLLKQHISQLTGMTAQGATADQAINESDLPQRIHSQSPKRESP